ncbi:MAG: response regulator [Solirubrobacteraceae bacterium]
MPTDTLSVLLADSQPFFRNGLRGMLETAGMSIVGEATTGVEAIMLAGEFKPDVVVIDLSMPEAPAGRALRQIATASPDSRIVVLTGSSDEPDVLEAFQAGASGFLFKSTRVDELVDGIRQAARGQAVLSHDAMRTLVSRTPEDPKESGSSPKQPSLTSRELDVLRLIVEGADNVAIGLELSISRHTVKQHVTNIFEKLEVRTRVEAAVYAVRAGLV